MKRRMSMLLSIILVTTSFIGCDEAQENEITPTTTPAVDEVTQDDVVIDDVIDDEIIDEVDDEDVIDDEFTEIDEEDVIADDVDDEDVVDDDVDDEKTYVLSSDNTDHLEQEIVQLNETDFELITTDTITGETSSLLVSSPPPTTEVPPPTTSEILTPTDNVDYNLHITTSDGMVLDNATIRISMSAIFPENYVPSTGDFMTSGPTVSNPITDGVTTFSVPDMRTISTYDYKLYIIIDIGKPFSITTPTVGRIPSVNGAIYTNSITLDFDIDDTDLYITITDESNI